MLIKRFGILAFVSCFLAIHSQGQTTNGLITGSVTDATGATVPGAVVTVTNPATGVPRTATSNESGTYVVPQLTPGSYDISVEKQGFATEKRSSVQMEVNQSLTLDFKLGVASAAQTVEVTGAAPARAGVHGLRGLHFVLLQGEQHAVVVALYDVAHHLVAQVWR